MWILCVIFFILWLFSVGLGMPSALVIFFFSMVVGSAAVGMMPRHDEQIEVDRE